MWYNNHMEENLTRIELFGGKHALIEFVFDDDTSYIIRAYDDEMNVVGCCYFDIEKLFQRQLSPEERLANAKYRGSLEKTPKTCELFVTKKDLHKYNIKENVLIFKTHGVEKPFPLKWAKCKLDLIEIKRKDFFMVGLGTAMYKIMEDFALKNDCTQIYAHFQPIGQFSSGSRKFYEHNGFTIEFDPVDQKQYATKIIFPKEKSTKQSHKNLDGGKR